MNCEAIVGNCYWKDDGGYHKIINCTNMMIDSSRDFYVMCLWHPFDTQLIGKTIAYNWFQRMGNGWKDAPKEGHIKDGFDMNETPTQWAMFNYKDAIHKIATGEKFMDKHWGEVEVVGFAALPHNYINMIKLVRPPCDKNDPQPICYLNWDEFFDRCTLFAGDAVTVCVSCQRDYPYAEPAVNFECWGCKNGF